MPVVPFVKSPHGLTKENTLILYNEARLFSAREAVLASISQIFRMKKKGAMDASGENMTRIRQEQNTIKMYQRPTIHCIPQ